MNIIRNFFLRDFYLRYCTVPYRYFLDVRESFYVRTYARTLKDLTIILIIGELVLPAVLDVVIPPTNNWAQLFKKNTDEQAEKLLKIP